MTTMILQTGISNGIVDRGRIKRWCGTYRERERKSRKYGGREGGGVLRGLDKFRI